MENTDKIDWSKRVRPHLLELTAYVPGITEEKLQRDTGLTSIYKYSSNEAPLPPSPNIVKAMQAVLAGVHRYPDSHALLTALSNVLAVPVESLILGNGSIDLIEALVHLFVGPGSNVVLSEYGYSAYPAIVKAQQASIRLAPSGADFGHDVDALLAQIDDETRMILMDSPTNMSGKLVDSAALHRFLSSVPSQVVVVLDEAYVEYVISTDGDSTHNLPLHHSNVVVTRTFSKAYGLAGLRVGYAIANPELLNYLHRIRPPFPVGSISIAAAMAALTDREHIDRIVEITQEGRRKLCLALQSYGIEVIEGQGNFVLANFGARATTVYQQLLDRGFITRAMYSYGKPDHVRISIGNEVEMAQLSACIGQLINGAISRREQIEHS